MLDVQVWSRKPRKGLDAIPYRLDEHVLAVCEQNPFGTLLPQQVRPYSNVSLSCRTCWQYSNHGASPLGTYDMVPQGKHLSTETVSISILDCGSPVSFCTQETFLVVLGMHRLALV